MQRIWWTLIGIIAVFLIAGWIDLPGTHNALGQNVTVKKGLDLAGGARILLCAKQSNPSSADMNTARDVINSRIAGGFGLTEPQVAKVGSNCISAEIPGISNKDQARVFSIIGKTGYLALTDSGSQSLAPQTKVQLVCKAAGPDCPPHAKIGVTNLTARPPTMQIIVPGKYVQRGSAQVAYDASGNPVVNYTLTGTGSNNWCDFTTANVGKQSAIVLDNQVVSDPTIQGAICAGQTQITFGAGSTTDQAKQIATYLNYGALPIALHVDSSQQVAASLGPEYVREATLAGAIGLIIVALFMMLYYRLPGLIADFALIIYAVVVFALFKLLGVTLTLAGIAGFILSIGMAVDANVLIFERMKEELRSGRTLGGAVEAGFSRAFPSIRDSNASTLITTVILFWFGHNFAATVITGFATTLFIGVAVSFITAYIVSRTFLRLLVHSGTARTAQMYGVESMAGAPVV